MKIQTHEICRDSWNCVEYDVSNARIRDNWILTLQSLFTRSGYWSVMGGIQIEGVCHLTNISLRRTNLYSEWIVDNVESNNARAYKGASRPDHTKDKTESDANTPLQYVLRFTMQFRIMDVMTWEVLDVIENDDFHRYVQDKLGTTALAESILSWFYMQAFSDMDTSCISVIWYANVSTIPDTSRLTRDFSRPLRQIQTLPQRERG